MKRKIIAYILLLPTIVVLLHAIFPHHHHFDNFFGNDIEKHCKHVHHEKHQSHSTHCHAFNSTKILINRNTTTTNIVALDLLNYNILQILNNTLLKYIKVYFVNINIPLLTSEFFTQNPFRGPPVCN